MIAYRMLEAIRRWGRRGLPGNREVYGRFEQTTLRQLPERAIAHE